MNMNILKKVIIGLIVSCVLVKSMPCFSIRSEAAEAVIATETAKAYLTYLTSYLVSRGYSAPTIAQDPDNTLVMNGGNSIITDFVNSFIDKLKLANTAQTTALLYALERAKNSGVFSITSETDSFLKSYLANNTIDSDIVLGNSTNIIYPIEANQTVDFSFSLTQPSVVNSPVYSASISFKVPYQCLPFLSLSYNSYGILEGFVIYFLPTERVNLSMQQNGYFTGASTTFVSNANIPTPLDPYVNNFDTNNRYLYTTFSVWGSGYQILGYTLPSILTTTGATKSDAQSIYEYLILNGNYDNSQALKSSQIYDTSNVDVLSVASEVDPNTGVVTPGFTYYMKDLSLFQELIQQFNQGIISWNSLIKSMGLSSVSASATVDEKQQAMDKVAYPDSTYDWLASTTWGETLTQPVVEEAQKYHTEEVAKSNAIGDLLAYQAGGDLPEEDKEKAYNSMLLGSLLMWLGIWRPPNLSGEDPNGGGIGPEDPDDPYGTSGYIADTIAGVSVASGLIDAAFNSAGGSNGFGIVFTLGATFVIFSVLIGAANYFGSKGDDVENSNSSSKPNKRPARSKQKSKPHKIKKAG